MSPIPRIFCPPKTLDGSGPESEVIDIRQDGAPPEEELGVSEYYVHLEDIDGDEVLLFLTDYGNSGTYQPLNPSDAMHGIDGGEIIPRPDSQIQLPRTVDDLRERLEEHE